MSSAGGHRIAYAIRWVVPYTWLAIALERLRGISADEVIEVLGADRRMPVSASHDGLPVLTIWARTRAGRPLIVALRPLGKFDYEIVGASDMTDEQQQHLCQWEERQS
jgi:hypothetical protein